MSPKHLLCGIVLVFSIVFGVRSSSNPLSSPTPTPNYKSPSLLHRNAIAGGIALRILPLGDSITYGEGSTTGNGYRLLLHNLLLHTHNEPTYIGRITSGTMPNNANEGYPGYPIASIADAVTPAYPDHPNIILLMAGTNDMIQAHPINTSSTALSHLVAKITTANPDAVLLVAEITPLLDPKREAARREYNSAIPGIIKPYADRGIHVAVVAMSRVLSHHINQTDGIHPNDAGYDLIAYAWYDAIVTADQRGWFGIRRSKHFPSSKTIAEWRLREVGVYVVMALVVGAAVRKLVCGAVGRWRWRWRS